MIRIFIYTIFVACNQKQPQPVVGSGDPCAQYDDGICPLYNADSEEGSSQAVTVDKNITADEEEPDSDPTVDKKGLDSRVYTGLVLRDGALYPVFLVDGQQQPISKRRFRYGGAGFNPKKSELPVVAGLDFDFELVVDLEFAVGNAAGVFCARTSLAKDQLSKILHFKNGELQADELPFAKKKRGGYPKLTRMDVEEGPCR